MRYNNVSLQHIEYGNEFYLDEKNGVFKFATPADYIDTLYTNSCTLCYHDFIHNHFNTAANPTMKYAVVGAVSDEGQFGLTTYSLLHCQLFGTIVF